MGSNPALGTLLSTFASVTGSIPVAQSAGLKTVCSTAVPVQLLLDLKADPGVRNRDGKTPLEQARRWKLDSIVTVLEHADAAKVTLT